ncbi:MAG: hypothetical protein ACYTGP_13495 [Planctomycetota bacterium]
MSGKICVICGEDCAGRPRTKDGKGRYYCQPCYDDVKRKIEARKAAAAAPPPPPPPPAPIEDDPFSMLDEVVGDAPTPVPGAVPAPAGFGQETCPGCGGALAADAVVCTSCGYNKQTGTSLQVTEEKPKRDFSGLTSRFGLVATPPGLALLILGLEAVCIGLGFMSGAVGGVAVLGFFALALVVGVTHTVILLVEAFRAGILHGILTLFIPFYGLYVIFGLSDNRYLKWLTLVVFLQAFGFGVLVAAVGAGLEGVGS